MATQKTLLTAEDLWSLPDGGRRYELIQGELREMTPPGVEHGLVCGNAFGELRDFIKPRQLGHLLINDAGIILRRGPDTVRGGDVAFFAAGRRAACPRAAPS